MQEGEVSPDAARAFCEAILKKERQERVDNGILKSQLVVIDRLLASSVLLVDAYQDLYRELAGQPPALTVLVDRLLSVTAFWSPKATAKARQGRDQLKEVNRQIASQAKALARLLEHRSDLMEHSGFGADTLYSPAGLIKAAANAGNLYRADAVDELEALADRYDLKYWPSLSQMLDAFGI